MNASDDTTEDISTKLGNGIDFNELTSRHIGTLRAVAGDRVDYENEKMIEMLETLQILGLVDDTQRLTPSGTQAIELAETLGGSKERRRAAAREDVKVDVEDLYDDDYAANSEEDIRFVSAYKANRFGTLT